MKTGSHTHIYIENINHLWKHLQSTSHGLRSATCSIIPEGPKTWKTVAAELMLSGAKVSGLGSVTGKSTNSPTKWRREWRNHLEMVGFIISYNIYVYVSLLILLEGTCNLMSGKDTTGRSRRSCPVPSRPRRQCRSCTGWSEAQRGESEIWSTWQS